MTRIVFVIVLMTAFVHCTSVARSLDQGSDACPATVIGALPYTDLGSTTGLAEDYPSVGCLSLRGPDAIYQYVASSTASHTISLCGSGYDTGLAIRTGGPCPGTTEVACNDDVCGTSSQIILTLNAGQTYWIVINGYGSSAGDYTLNVSTAVQANDCPGHVIPALPFSDAGNSCDDANDFVNCVGPTSRDTVYAFTPAVGREVLVSLCGSSYDTALEIRSDGDCPGDNQVSCNDDNGPACPGLQSSIQFTAFAGVPYFIIVHGYSSSCGTYVITVSAPPSLGRCCYDNGNSCSQGISQTECEEQLSGVFDPDLDCSTPCPCAAISELVFGPASAAGTQLCWQTHSNGIDQVWSCTNRNNDGNPDGGLDTMWTLRYAQPVTPGSYAWIETDFSLRYRNYVLIHVCP